MKLKKRIRRLIILCCIFLIIAAAGIVVKNIVLNQVRNQISTNFSFRELRLALFPPVLVIEDVRALSSTPFFSADRISIRISFRSLLRKNKPIDVHIENPVLRIYTTGISEGERQARLHLPFEIRKGLLRNGKLQFWGDDIRADMAGVDARFSQRQDRFDLLVKSEENSITFRKINKRISGKLTAALEGEENKLAVKRLRFFGDENYFHAHGNIENLSDPSFELRTSFKLKAPLIVSALEIPFDWKGRVEGNGLLSRRNGEVRFKGDFESRRLSLNGTRFSFVEGNIEYGPGTIGSLDAYLSGEAFYRQHVNIRFDRTQIEGSLGSVHLDPIMSYLEVPWPVASPAWGRFTLAGKRLTAEVEFRDKRAQPVGDLYPVSGLVDVTWDGEEDLKISSEEVITSFARVKVQGQLVLQKDLDVLIEGEVKDVGQTRAFLSRILDKEFLFPEIRGKGEGKVRIVGDYFVPRVESGFNLSPGGFDLFDAQNVWGSAEITGDDFAGYFQVDDPRYKGRINVVAGLKQVRAEIDMESGRIENILPSLRIDLPLSGSASGKFVYSQNGKEEDYRGDFFGWNVLFAGLPLSDVQGSLKGTQDTFSLPEISGELYGGNVAGSFALEILSSKFAIDAEVRDVDLSRIYPSLTGKLAAKVRGAASPDGEKADGTFRITPLLVPPFQQTESGGTLKLGVSETLLSVAADGNFFPGDNSFELKVDIPLDGGYPSGSIDGLFNNLDLLLPWEGAEGRLDYLVEFQPDSEEEKIQGVLDFEGDVFPFPRFPHAVRDYRGLVYIKDDTFEIRSFDGTIGGGVIQNAEGFVRIEAGEVAEIDVRADGKDLELSLLERTKAKADGWLHLVKDPEKFVLEGNFLVNRLSWRREIDEEFAFSSSPYPIEDQEEQFFDTLTLDIHISGGDNIIVQNEMMNLRAQFDLTFGGSIKSPILEGQIEALEGDVYYQDQRYRILRGRLSFFNPLAIEPYINFRGETYVKNYRVTVSLAGLLDKKLDPNDLNLEFNSSPPLPPEDVITLLQLGDAFRRTYDYDRTRRQGTASLVSFTLAEEAQKRAQSLFSIDRFRLDPFVMGSSPEMTARLTLGKKISRNFSLVYSTNLASQREEITRVEWEISRDLSIVGTRDEEGRLSIDVKIHKRF